MQKTRIEWVRNPDGSPGYTFNPITGCLNNCSYCYARRLANGQLRQRYLAQRNTGLNFAQGADPFYPRFWPGRLANIPVLKAYQGRFSSEVKNALLAKQSKGIFVCNMSDLFGVGIPEEWTHLTMEAIKRHPEHRFYLLTKQPQNLHQWSPFPDNAWVGVSATNDLEFFERSYQLRHVRASLKYISFEPLLNWSHVEWANGGCYNIVNMFKKDGINWVIIGAQTKPYKSPRIEWVKEIVEACVKAKIPVFLKDNLLPLAKANRAWPAMDVKLRQEMPK